MKHFKVVMTCCCCLVFTQAATAQMFTGVSANIKTQPIEEVPGFPIDCTMELGLDVCNVFAEFDDVFPNVKMISVTMSTIQAEGLFYQDTFGNGNIAPQCNLIPVFPSLQCDTFVTMNRKNNCAGVDMTTPDPSFAFGENATGSTVTGGWFNGNPANDQGHPQPTGTPGLNQVLIAQFSVPSGGNVSGMMELSWQAPDGGPVVFSNDMFECQPVVGVCGDGNVDDGEQCDDGNTDPGDCCDANCQFEAPGSACGDPSDTECDAADTCDGMGNCQDNLEPAGTPCGDPSSGECDNADSCDGMGMCQDNNLPDGTACGDQGVECQEDDSCMGGMCADGGASPAGAPCGDPSNTECDNPDSCDGMGGCQINNEPDGTACGDQGVECQEDDSCSGGMCADGGPSPAGTGCGDPSEGDCDAADSCDGQGTCNDNSFPPGTPCGDGSDTDCDNPDSCDAMGVCQDNLEPPGAPCGDPSSGECDNADSCDGMGMCQDNNLPDGTACGDQGVQCLLDDSCLGGECADGGFEPLSTPCDEDNNMCTIDHCNGEGACVLLSEVICQDPNPPCEGGQFCDPVDGCVDNMDAPVSTFCEADGDLCTNDHCNGIGNCVFLSDVICQDPNPPCEGGQECDPAAGCVDLPDAPASTMCELDGDLCTGEHCDGGGSCVDYPDGDVICPEGEICEDGQCVPDQPDEAQTLIIKQGACPVPLNPGSNGVLPTVLVGDFDFDVFDVDIDSLQLCRCDGVGGCVAPVNGPPGPGIKYNDLNHPFEDPSCGSCSCNADQSSDGITDLALKFKVSELAEILMLDSEAGGSVITLELVGSLSDGTLFNATDCISIRPPGAALPDSLAVESNIVDTFIDVTPLDLLYDEGGYASFIRWYQGGTTVTVTAPVVNHAGLFFAYWEVNGVAQPTGQRTLDISVIGETNIEAVYRPGRLLQPENLPVGFQRPDGSFGNGG